ncbi:GNAT family N-acetyltransferase [Bifidobacterium platyrrhinorum]|uniref:GNAT family N-acetyltransferase n=1 Tax=Bifidobacterium platyrrhinorum TaxID=2661628 RepID=A0A6L9STD7_9BIFI|nr:GNAT family N-acetyltransferase [Bifidobacterium platyrrhinorum]NEG55848.1 GNAT family N-acetyltransferase [Bifidobacterium platyrrhinorum]
MAANDAATTSTAVIYRPIRADDLDAIVEAFHRTWGVDEPDGPAITRLTSRHFVLHYLEPATRGEIAETPDGAFMGVTLVRIAGEPALFPWVGGELARVNAELDATAAGADALVRTEAWHALEERMEDDIAINDRARAEVELFLVDAAARGHGVGGTLWRHMLDAFARAGVNRYYLHTDSSCDVGFYDHKGLARVAERYAKDHPGEHVGDGEDIFIYEGGVEPAFVDGRTGTGIYEGDVEPTSVDERTGEGSHGNGIEAEEARA